MNKNIENMLLLSSEQKKEVNEMKKKLEKNTEYNKTTCAGNCLAKNGYLSDRSIEFFADSFFFYFLTWFSFLSQFFLCQAHCQ